MVLNNGRYAPYQPLCNYICDTNTADIYGLALIHSRNGCYSYVTARIVVLQARKIICYTLKEKSQSQCLQRARQDRDKPRPLF